MPDARADARLPSEYPVEVAVVGSGAGGAAAALALARAGREVLVLEAGPRVGTPEFSGVEAEMLPRLLRASTTADRHLDLYAGHCVGGSTVVNDALCWRPPPEILARWHRERALSELAPHALAPFVERAWAELGARPTGRPHLSRNAFLLELGAHRLGLAAGPVPRNVEGCSRLGLCNLGCPTGAKQSALRRLLPRAEAAGARIAAGARVTRVRVEGGRVRELEVHQRGPGEEAPRRVRVRPRAVVLAAGVLGTAPLLIASGVEAPGLGRGVQVHTSVQLAARFREPVHAYYGPTMGFAVTAFSDVDGGPGPGFVVESCAGHPALAAPALPGLGEEHEARMRALPHLARCLVLLRDHRTGHFRRDGTLELAPHAGDLARLRAGLAAAARIYLAAGAVEVLLPVEGLAPIRGERDLAAFEARTLDPMAMGSLYAVHLFGGASLAGSVRLGPCRPDGTVRGVRGLLVADASGLPGNLGVNPQVTITANALRVAEQAVAEGHA